MTPKLRWKALACAGSGSRVLMPTKRATAAVSDAAACRSAASLRQGAHQDPHTFRTSTLPPDSAVDNDAPSRVVPCRTGATGLRSTGINVTEPSPDT